MAVGEMHIPDPIDFCSTCWPDIELYGKQKEILHSVRDNDETFVPAGNELGKDFIAALVVLWFFCTRRPVKVVTTSVQGAQLEDVLWAEIRRFLDTTAYELPIQYNHLHIRHVRKDGTLDPRSSLTGQVTRQGESLLGRHIEKGVDGVARTLAVFDEASAISDTTYDSTDTWAHKKLIIGNPYTCNNFFFHGVQRGDLKATGNNHYYRKVLRIKAEESPNVRYAQAQVRKGDKVTNEILIPGVVDYPTYMKRRELWNPVRQCIGLDGEFYLGSETLLYPPNWLNLAETYSETLQNVTRKATAIGVDPAEGGDETAIVVIDDLGIIELIAKRTPNTSVIPDEVLALMRKYRVPAECVMFDAGGGGKEHVDRLRSEGHNVRAVAFGESAGSRADRFMRRVRTRDEKRGIAEDRYVYKNRRAEMYGMLRVRLDPGIEGVGRFAIPAKYKELRRQLSPLPLIFDNEGQLTLPPKKRTAATSTVITITDLIGCSPDRADALVLAVYGASDRAAPSVASVGF